MATYSFRGLESMAIIVEAWQQEGRHDNGTVVESLHAKITMRQEEREVTGNGI